MKKSDLLILPSHRLPHFRDIKNLPQPKCEVPIQYILTASIHNVNKSSILKATLFDADTHTASFLLFFDRDQEEFWTYRCDTNSWSEACLHNLIGGRTPLLTIAHADRDSLTMGSSYFRQPSQRTTANCILEFQLAVRSGDNCMCRYRMNTKGKSVREQYQAGMLMDTVMAQLEPLPKDFTQFSEKRIFHMNYLYYQRNGKTLTGFCTHCRQDVMFPAPEVKGTLYNHLTVCPQCRKQVILKPHGRACNLVEDGRMEYIQRIDDGYLIRSFYIERTIPKEYRHKFRYQIVEDYRTFFCFDGRTQDYLFYTPTFSNNSRWITEAFYRRRYYGNPYSTGGTLYTPNLYRVFHGGPFQYCQLAEFSRHMEIVHSKTYLERYRDAPCLEYMVKLKMYRLLGDLLDRRYSLHNPSGKTPAEVFGVSKRDVKILVRLNVSGEELNFWRWCRSNEAPITENDMKLIQSCPGEARNLDPIKRISRMGSLSGTIRYLVKHCKSSDQNLSGAGSDYFDYLCACEKLKYDLSDDNVRYPRNLKKAHDAATRTLKIMQNRKQDQKIRSRFAADRERYSYQEKKLLVTLPSCAEDLILEGQKMHHCVGTYLDRVADGDCTILFIRRTDAPEEPYVTAEIRENRLIQIRAKNNENPPKKVKDFWKRYEEAVLKAEAIKTRVRIREAG